MTTFGDVRAAVQNRSRGSAETLAWALYHYRDDTPACVVLAYVLDNWGWCPAYEWSNYWGRKCSIDAVHRYQTKKPLFAYLYIGDYEHMVLRLDNPEDAIQKVLAKRRQECLDKIWLPYAEQKPSDWMDEATELLQGCVHTHTNYDYRQSARRAVGWVIGGSSTSDENRRLWRAVNVVTARSMKQMLNKIQPRELSPFSASTIEAALLGGWK